MVILQFPLARPVDAAPKGAGASGVSPAAAVWETAVVPRDRKSGQRLLHFQTLVSSGSGMIHLWPAVEAALKSIGVFSDVVGYTGQLSLFLCIKSCRKGGTQRCGPFQMAESRLLPSVYREMCQIFMCVHNETASR